MSAIRVPVTSQAAISVDKNMSQFPRVSGLWNLEEEETIQPHRHTDRRVGGRRTGDKKLGKDTLPAPCP